MTTKKPSALSEKKGVQQPTSINKKHRVITRKNYTAEQYVKEITKGNISFLSKAITIIESKNKKHKILANKIISLCLPYANNSIRIGITGVPGVGKSTFIESFGKHLTQQGKKVAVLAVDPSSSINKGSILGDKTRMEELVKDKNAFIRPSPSGLALGGVAQKTRESIILCEAAGFNTILVETVGVGQSETYVYEMVDFFLLLKLAGAGDELQGIKRGIMEMADGIVINKADGENIQQAKIAKVKFTQALHLYPSKRSDWTPKIILTSALQGKGIADAQEMIEKYFAICKKDGSFQTKRSHQNSHWLFSTIENELKNRFYTNPTIKSILEEELEKVKRGKTTPFIAAQKILNYS